MEALRDLDIKKHISVAGLDPECQCFSKQESAWYKKEDTLESEELWGCIVLTITLWTIKINNTNLYFFPYKMGLIVFSSLAQKEFYFWGPS